MSLISMLEKRTKEASDDKWYYPGGFFYGGASGTGGIPTKSGTNVSETNAIKLAVVWACVKILSEDPASLPLFLYRRLSNGGKERAVNHNYYSLLHDSPNPEMCAFAFRETFMTHVLLWGNAYAEKEFGRGSLGRDRVVALWPIIPTRVTPKRNERKQVEYHVNMAGMGVPSVILPKEKILHMPGLSFNGLVGLSPIAAARETIGAGLALEEFGQLYFGQGVHPSAVVTHPGHLEDKKELREALNETYGGLGKSHRLMLLEEGMSIAKLGIPNDEAQFIETRKLTNIDIGTRIYRVPPYMYGEMDKTAFANVEQQAIDYVSKTLRPWLVRLEQSFTFSILNAEERGEYFFEHLVDGLLRGDIKSRYEAYAIGRNNGWLNGDEIRERENMNPMENDQGKIYLIPLNMISAAEIGKTKKLDATEQKSFDNRRVYRKRIEIAYKNLICDTIRRITRKETRRINWILKNGGDSNAMEEFYQEFPDYIKKQANPAIISFVEALTDMETELSGLKHDDFKPEIQRFIDVFVSNFASDYVETSQNLNLENGEWIEREAESIAKAQIKNLADAYIQHLRALMGMNS